MEEKTYGVRMTIERPETSSRFWAIPLVGILIKSIILIPHIIILYIMQLVVGIFQLVVWIPVLFGGRYPDWAFGLVSGLIRSNVRISGYIFGLTDAYPPFQFGDETVQGTKPYPIGVEFVRPRNSSRFWAIPVVGIFVKSIILIPHVIIMYIMTLIIGILQLITWIPVLFGGRYPGWPLDLIGGTLQWQARFQAFYFGLTDEYPPFSLSGGRRTSFSSAATPA